MHGVRVWTHDGSWFFTAEYNGVVHHGEAEDALDARLAGIQWLGMQDRPPIEEVLAGVERVRREWLGRQGKLMPESVSPDG